MQLLGNAKQMHYINKPVRKGCSNRRMQISMPQLPLEIGRQLINNILKKMQNTLAKSTATALQTPIIQNPAPHRIDLPQATHPHRQGRRGRVGV